MTLLDRRFVVEGSDAKFPYETVVVLGMEMRKEWLMQAPNYRLRRYPDYDVYRRAGNAVHRVAHFIRRQGVSCSARVPFNGAAVYPVHAITAGLGELGAFGGVLTPEFGPRQRWCMITVDADLPPDDPADHRPGRFLRSLLALRKEMPGPGHPGEAAVVARGLQTQDRRPQVLGLLHRLAYLRRVRQRLPPAPLRTAGGPGVLREDR